MQRFVAFTLLNVPDIDCWSQVFYLLFSWLVFGYSVFKEYWSNTWLSLSSESLFQNDSERPTCIIWPYFKMAVKALWGLLLIAIIEVFLGKQVQRCTIDPCRYTLFCYILISVDAFLFQLVPMENTTTRWALIVQVRNATISYAIGFILYYITLYASIQPFVSLNFRMNH